MRSWLAEFCVIQHMCAFSLAERSDCSALFVFSGSASVVFIFFWAVVTCAGGNWRSKLRALGKALSVEGSSLAGGGYGPDVLLHVCPGPLVDGQTSRGAGRSQACRLLGDALFLVQIKMDVRYGPSTNVASLKLAAPRPLGNNSAVASPPPVCSSPLRTWASALSTQWVIGHWQTSRDSLDTEWNIGVRLSSLLR